MTQSSSETINESSLEEVNKFDSVIENTKLNKTLSDNESSVDDKDDNENRGTSLNRELSNKVTRYKTTRFSTTNIDKIENPSINKIVKSKIESNKIRKKIDTKSIDSIESIGSKIYCGYCNKQIYDDNPMKFESQSFHRYCFKCSSCNAKLDNSLNLAYRCEIEKRFYCINCCDCQCWLTNSDKKSNKFNQNNQEKSDKFNQNNQEKSNKLNQSNQEKLDKIDNDIKVNLQIDETITKKKSNDKIDKKLKKNKTNVQMKKCKFCNQSLPDQLNKNNQNKSTKELDSQIPKAPPLPNSMNKIDFDQNKFVSDEKNIRQQFQNQLNQNLVDQQNEINLREQHLKKINLVQQSKKRKKFNSDRQPIVGQQEERKIRLVKKPTIGPRIAQLIDKLENSLNQNKERKFQENFYKNLGQCLKTFSKEHITEQETNEQNETVELNNLNRLNLKNQRALHDDNLAYDSVNQNDKSKEQKFRTNVDLIENQVDRPNDQYNQINQINQQTSQLKRENIFKSTKQSTDIKSIDQENIHYQQNKAPTIKAITEQSIYCPNCKVSLSNNFFLKKQNEMICDPLCRYHCMSNVMIEKRSSSIKNENKNFKPYNLLLNIPRSPRPNQNKHIFNESNNQKKFNSPKLNFNETVDRKQPTNSNRKTNSNDHKASINRLDNTQMCCRCGLKICLNGNKNCNPVSNVLQNCLHNYSQTKCSICECSL